MLEDDYTDVLNKSMAGASFDPTTLAERLQVPRSIVKTFLEGDFCEELSSRVCALLGLNSPCLSRLALGLTPPAILLPKGLRRQTTPFPVSGYTEMTVNTYSFALAGQHNASILIDATGSFQEAVCVEQGESGDVPRANLFLTHTHADHVADFDRWAPFLTSAHVSRHEPFAYCAEIEDGDYFEFGPLRVQAIATPGHSVGGMTYLLLGAETPVAFVGDAIF